MDELDTWHTDMGCLLSDFGGNCVLRVYSLVHAAKQSAFRVHAIRAPQHREKHTPAPPERAYPPGLPPHLKNTSEAVKREKNKIMTAMLVWLKGYMPTREHRIPDTSSDTQWVRNQEPQYPTSPRPAFRGSHSNNRHNVKHGDPDL
eukprot:1161645-Pelagomonas_calceolata.AAC.11